MGARGSFRRPITRKRIKAKGDPEKPYFVPSRLSVVKGLSGRLPRKSPDPRMWEMMGKVSPGARVIVEENEDIGRTLKRLKKAGSEGKPNRGYK